MEDLKDIQSQLANVQAVVLECTKLVDLLDARLTSMENMFKPARRVSKPK